MKNFLIVFTIIASQFICGQSYEKDSKAAELCLVIQENSFMSDKDADKALEKILSTIGASKRFIMQPCSNIDNAVATSYQGVRYILYDKEFMDKIANETNNWSQTFVLAHEVGHHINGHSIDLLLSAAKVVEPKTIEVRRLQELESDEFAGFVLAKLGATLEQTQAAVKILPSDTDDTYSTHPNKTKRLNAIEIGYNNALVNISDDSRKLIPINTSKVGFKYPGKTPQIYQEQYQKLTPTQKAEQYFYSGYEKHSKGDYYGAISDYNKAIEINPNDAVAYRIRGVAKRDLKDYNGAISDYNKAIEINPNDAKAYNNRGFVKDDLKDYNGAISDYNKAIEINPNDAKAYNNRGFAKIYLKDYQGAISDYNKAIEINPNNAHAYKSRGFAKIYLKDYHGAISDYNKAIEINPNNANAYNSRGFAKAYLKNSAGAISDYNKAIEIDPNYADAYYNRGKEKYINSDLQGACGDARKAQQLGHDYATKLIQDFCK